MSAIIILLLFVNLAISIFNAWSVGRSWAESKAVGGIARLMAWCGATMSACGFTWCYLVLLCLFNMALPDKYALPPKYMEAVFRLGYLAIILPVIGSGLAITLQSWAYFWQERNFKNGAIAGWNTFAEIYDMYTACHAIPESLGFLKDLWKSDDEDRDAKSYLWLIVATLAILCVIGGVLTTAMIIRVTARNVAETQYERAAKANEPMDYPSNGYRRRQYGYTR